MEKLSILITDDESAQRQILSGYLIEKGFRVFEASSANEGLTVIQNNIIDIVLCDYKMPGINGIEFLYKIKKDFPEIAVILITAFGTIENAVEAIRAGADDYITKPVDLDMLDFIINRISKKNILVSENKFLKEQLSLQNNFPDIIAASPSMQSVLNVAYRVADTKATVLLRGESGSGKEVIARAIHLSGNRKNKPFIAVNCAALNENLLESELFGHEKGAFTGADKQKMGRFELANTGTIFLDEIGDLPPATQIKLLRVLQEETFERVGGTESISVDIRIIAATNRNLEELMKEGLFREDLFYRLNVITITLPSLRERKDDLLELINHFINKYKKDSAGNNIKISREAFDLLSKYNFPGNIRELENIIHHSIILTRDDLIKIDDLPAYLSDNSFEDDEFPDEMNMPQQVESLEKKLIHSALQNTGGNQSKAAKILGISERNLRYKLAKYNIKKK